MAFGFSMDRGGCALSFWNKAQGRAEHPALSWGRGKPYFESCLMVEPSGLQLGAGARVRFLQADSAEEAGNFLDDISAQLLEMPPTRFPARQAPLTGRQILEELFQMLGGELRAAGKAGESDVLAMAAPAALERPAAERLRQCAERTGLQAQIYPSWFLQTLCCLNDDPEPPCEGRILFLDYGADESCAVCCVLQRQNGLRALFPCAVVLAGNGLTHRGTAERLLQELLQGGGSFRGFEAEEAFRNRRDWGLLVREAERVRAHLMGRGAAADFSVGGLYGNRYAERSGLTAEWFSRWLAHTGWQAAAQALAQQALDRAGWGALQVDRVYISRRSGLPFRNAVLGLQGLAAKPCPQWQKNAMQAADGAALYAGRLGSPEQIGLLPERKP